MEKGQISEARKEFWELVWMPFFWPFFVVAFAVYPLIMVIEFIEDKVSIPNPFAWIAEKLEPFTDYIINEWIDR